MALLFFDGFDHTDSTTNSYKWEYYADASNTASAARTGAQGLAVRVTGVPEDNIIRTKVLPTSGGFVVGFAMKFRSAAGWPQGYDTNLVHICEGAISHLIISHPVAGAGTTKLNVKRGTGVGNVRGGTILATGTTTTLVADVWYYIEVKGVIGSSGSFEIKIDGVSQPELTVSGVNTRNGGVGIWDRVGFQPGANYDDFYVCDQSGSTFNNFLGDCRVDLLMPQTDALALGTHHAWTPTSGTDHGALVDDAPSAGAFNWLASYTAGDKESVHLPLRKIGRDTIIAIQTNIQVRRTDTDERTLRPLIRTPDGTDHFGATVLPNAIMWGHDTQRWITNPATGTGWLAADVVALEVGVQVVV